jgi:dTDP-4-amino-4,6-dideoxygalactose transaminase
VYYPVPLHRQQVFLPLGEPALPVAEGICRTALALPIFPAMTDAQQERVIAQATRFHG